MKMSFTINGKRFTEKALKAALGEARIEDIKLHCVYLNRMDALARLDWPIDGAILRISIKGGAATS